MLRVTFACLLVASTTLAAPAATPPAPAMGTAPEAELSLRDLQNPFWAGPAASLNTQYRGNTYLRQVSSQLYLSYGLERGISISLGLPVIWSESRPTLAGAESPRVGGGLLSRLSLEAHVRLWGDTYRYFGMSMGIGFPWQSDPSVQNSLLASFVIPISAFGRLDFEWIALLANLSNQINFPASVTYPATDLFLDRSNQFIAVAAAAFYPREWISPSLSYTEAWPTRTDIAVDSSDRAFLLSSAMIPRVRIAAISADLAPGKAPMLISPTVGYFLSYAPTSYSPWQFSWRLRWAF